MESESVGARSDIAYSHILKKIIDFSYKPGYPLVEADLCKEVGVSRTPLREALNRLEAEGFATRIRNRGFFVRNYSRKDIIDSCNLRSLLEVYSLESCIDAAQPDELHNMRSMLLRLKKDSSNQEFYVVDTALHSMITKYCDNARIHSILGSLSVQIDAIQKISGQTPNRLWASRTEHLDILDAIETPDLPLAQLRLGDHINRVRESCLMSFDSLRVRS